MTYTFLRVAAVVFIPLLLGLAMVYIVHTIVGFFVTTIASDERAPELLKAYRKLAVLLSDILTIWLIGAIIWWISA